MAGITILLGYGSFVDLEGAAWERLREAPGLMSHWDWRHRLEDRGLRWNAYHLTYLGGLWDGGRRSQAARLSSSIDLILRLDAETLVRWEGLDALSHLKSTHGQNINPLIGSRSQAIDDADFSEWFWIDQLWLRQFFHNRTWSIQAGYLDQQTILDRNNFANSEDRQFMAQYLDNNNAIVPLRVGLGANIRWYPTPSWDWSLGIADADNRPRLIGWNTFFDGPGSLVTFSQIGRKINLGELSGNIRLGGYFDARTQRIHGTTASQSGHFGLFVSADQRLYHEATDETQGLGTFVRYGYHDASVNAFAHFWSIGIQYDGLIPDRHRDRFGSGFYQVRPSAKHRQATGTHVTAETGLECYYLLRLSPWATLTPNIQYIWNPGGDQRTENAIITNLRLRLTF